MTRRALPPVVVLLAALPAPCATVDIVLDGANCVRIVLTPGPAEEVGGLQFDLQWSGAPATVDRVETGAAARTASKEINYNLLAPGRFRAIVAGMNRNSMLAGPVAQIWFSGPVPGGLELTGVILSDPFGNRVPAQIRGLDGARASVAASRPSQRASMIAAVGVAVFLLAVSALGIKVAAARARQSR